MSAGERARTRESVLRRGALIAGALVLLAVLLFATGHWILGVIFALPAAVATWVFLQARTVR
jgi:hypothetical protein